MKHVSIISHFSILFIYILLLACNGDYSGFKKLKATEKLNTNPTPVPTQSSEASTEEQSSEASTEEQSSEASTEEQSSEASTEEQSSEASTEEQSSEASTEEQSSEASTEEQSSEASTEEQSSEASTEEQSSEASTEEQSSEASTEEQSSEASTEEQSSEASTEEQPSEASTEQQPSEASTEEQPSEASTEQQPSQTFTEQQPSQASTEPPQPAVGSSVNIENIFGIEPIRLTTGSDSACVIMVPDGGVQCWGSGGAGELGNGGTEDSRSPVNVIKEPESTLPLKSIIQVSVGKSLTCALNIEGQVKCWGTGEQGRLGNGQFESSSYPVTVVAGEGLSTPLQQIVQVSTGANHSCALTNEGEVKCWGVGDYSGLGYGGIEDKAVPVTVISGEGQGALQNVTQISVSASHSCVVTQSNEVKCWGLGIDGRLGNGGFENQIYPTTVIAGEGETSPLSDIVQVSAGIRHTCALTSNGEVLCWGRGEHSRLGYGEYRDKTHPVTVVTGEDNTPLRGVTQISTGIYHTCALISNGEVFCWGRGTIGELGHGQFADQRYPVKVVIGSDSSISLKEVTYIDVGYTTTCALTLEQKVKCWGYLGNKGKSYAVSVKAEGGRDLAAGLQLRVPPRTIQLEELLSYTLQTKDIVGLIEGRQARISVLPDEEIGITFDESTFRSSIGYSRAYQYRVRGTISDGFKQYPWSFLVNVEDNVFPRLEIDQQNIREGEDFSYTINESQNLFDHSEGESYIVVLQSNGSTGITYDDATKTFSGETNSLSQGFYYVRGYIEDDSRNFNWWSFTVRVTAPTDTP